MNNFEDEENTIKSLREPLLLDSNN